MRFDVGTASGSGRISNTRDKVLSIEFHARSDNANSAFAGRSDVSASNGRELTPDSAFAFNFGEQKEASVEFRFFYVSVTGGDKVDWSVILL